MKGKLLNKEKHLIVPMLMIISKNVKQGGLTLVEGNNVD